jgi:tetratricopeptide (TPR) repeat protein
MATVGFVLLWLLPGKTGRAIFFATAYYVISLFPVLGFFDIYFFRYSFVSDHFQYLASMGPLALAGAAMTQSFSQLAIAASLGRGAVIFRVGLCSILLVLVAGLTWRQSAVYHDLITLYTRTLARNPGCWMAHYNLGIALHDRGETDDAMMHYREAIALRPVYAEAHYNLARLLAEKREFADAIEHYEAALTINPTDAEAHNNLGATLFEVGRVDDAIAHYQQALAIRPDYAEASCNLANALIAKGDFDGAIGRYTACLAAIPNQEAARYNLASLLLRKGRMDEAIVEYQKVLQMHPDSADAHANLGSAWLTKGRVQDAMAEYTSALRISPENLAALSNLAWLLATSADPSLRDGSEAVRLAERAESASSRSETHPTVLRILAAAHAEAGQFAEAKEIAQHALEGAKVQGNTTLADALQGELALYDLGLPYHKQPK